MPDLFAIDLFCAGGGASVGLSRAGFDLYGIDIKLQKEYPFSFSIANALDTPLDFLETADLIWASPPCQAYSWGTRKGRENKFPDLVSATRDLLKRAGRPFIIENVKGAPIRHDLMLEGEMFGLGVIRIRYFEVEGFKVHLPPLYSRKGTVKNGDYVTACGHGGDSKKFSLKAWQEAMGIDWITDKAILAEAVPPAYAEFIGKCFIESREGGS